MALLDILEINEAYQIGGAQAIAALAYGTKIIHPVDKIFGPGNAYVVSARKQVFGKARLKGIKAKDYVRMKIEESYDTKKWCKTTTRGNWDKRNIDAYDGLVMALFEKSSWLI